MGEKIKVMSFNMRVATHADGKNSFWERKPRILEMLKCESPDVIGMQEVTDEMRLWLGEVLTGYTVVGCGREHNYGGESVACAFKNDRFAILEYHQYWLSPTPTRVGSCFLGDQSSCPRITTAMELACLGEEKSFMLYNTHLDHAGPNARYLGMMQNIQRISENNLNFVYTGDMNATPDSPEIGLVEDCLSYRGARDCTSGLEGTYHEYGTLKKPIKIDYIFSDCNCINAYVVKNDREDGLYYSDHFAVCAEIEI